MPDNTQSNVAVVIEDDASVRRMMLRALHELGLAGIGFSSAEAALTWLSMNKPPRFICVDVALPGISGFRACEILREDSRLRAVPILVCTARAHPEDQARALHLGCGYLAKPFALRGYMECARSACGIFTSIDAEASVPHAVHP